jgi:hypothetical protein
VFERDQNGPEAWREVATLHQADADGIPLSQTSGEFGAAVSIDGDLAVVGAWLATGFADFSGAAYVFSRHHGGLNAWGEVSKIAAADIVPPPHGHGRFSWDVSLSGNTVLAGDPGEGTAAYACALEDLDAPEAACRRAPLVFDNFVTTSGVRQSCCANSELVITATFTNTSASAVYLPGILVAELSGGNVLKNADGGPAGAGATLRLNVGDDFLSPGESTTVRFVIGLATRQPFRFFVHLTGEHQP